LRALDATTGSKIFDESSHLFAIIQRASSPSRVNPDQYLKHAMQPQPHRVKPISQWSPNLSVGNAKLDEQHITLLELGRDLLRLLETNNTTNDQVHGTLEDIVRLSRLHDALEESILEANGCPALAEHKAEHLAARSQLATLLADVSRAAIDKPVLVGLIADWMGHHISENDLPVKDYLRHVPQTRAAG
jgi:hemerythrin